MSEVFRITLGDTRHEIPWHTYQAADRMSFLAPRGVLMVKHPTHGDWRAVEAVDAERPEYAGAPVKFWLVNGKRLDMEGKRIPTGRYDGRANAAQ